MTRPLRIALIMQGGRSWIGGMEYIRNIILALASLPQDIRNSFEVSLLANSSTESTFINSVRPYVKDVHIIEELVPSTIYNRLRWTMLRIINKYFHAITDTRFNVILKKYSYDFTYPNTSHDSGFSFDRAVPWIPDFQHKYLPDLFSEQEIKERDRIFSRMALEGSMVVLSSTSAEADFKKYYPEAASKTRVLSFKTIPQQQWYEMNPLETQDKYSLPEKFFIISNQFWVHKNHLLVFKAMELLKQSGIKPVIVCTGHVYDYRQPEYSDTILQTIHKSGLSHQVYLLGLIPKIDQIQLLRRSIALIQPSQFEGWSTVVEDARCLGKPIIISDFPVHLEQSPPNSTYFIRTSPESLAEVMAEFWQSLSPGPDSENESEARQKNKEEVLTFAYDFLKIAKTYTKAS